MSTAPNPIADTPALGEAEKLSAELKVALVDVQRAIAGAERIATLVSVAARQLDISTDRLRRLARATMPAKPDPKLGPWNMSRGEREILKVLKEEGGEVDAATLIRRTHYKASSIRTYLPKLRERGLVHHTLNIAL